MLVSEQREDEKSTSYMIPTGWHSRKDQSVERVSRSVVAKGWGGGRDAWRGGHSEAILGKFVYYTITVATCHYTFIKICRSV